MRSTPESRHFHAREQHVLWTYDLVSALSLFTLVLRLVSQLCRVQCQDFGLLAEQGSCGRQCLHGTMCSCWEALGSIHNGICDALTFSGCTSSCRLCCKPTSSCSPNSRLKLRALRGNVVVVRGGLVKWGVM